MRNIKDWLKANRPSKRQFIAIGLVWLAYAGILYDCGLRNIRVPWWSIFVYAVAVMVASIAAYKPSTSPATKDDCKELSAAIAELRDAQESLLRKLNRRA